MTEEIKYKDLIDLGFKRVEDEDTVFENQNGYEYFWLEKTIKKHTIIDWTPDTKLAYLYILDREDNILFRRQIFLHEIKLLVRRGKK